MGAPERTACAQDGDTGATPLRSGLVTPAPRPRRGQCPKSPSSSSRVPNSVIHDRRQPWPPQHGAGWAWDTRDSPQRRAGISTPGRNHPNTAGWNGTPPGSLPSTGFHTRCRRQTLSWVHQHSVFVPMAKLGEKHCLKHLSRMRKTRVCALGWEDPLEKEMAIQSSTIAWKIPWTEGPGRLQSMGLQRVGHNWATTQKNPT